MLRGAGADLAGQIYLGKIRLQNLKKLLSWFFGDFAHK